VGVVVDQAIAPAERIDGAHQPAPGIIGIACDLATDLLLAHPSAGIVADGQRIDSRCLGLGDPSLCGGRMLGLVVGVMLREYGLGGWGAMTCSAGDGNPVGGISSTNCATLTRVMEANGYGAI
jgi:hypothetical protein